MKVWVAEEGIEHAHGNELMLSFLSLVSPKFGILRLVHKILGKVS